MQVSAISSNQGFTGKTRNRENVDRVISMSDNELASLAYLKSVENAKKRRKNVNRLFNAVPIVGALSAGILTRGKASMFGKEVSGLAAKSVNAVKVGGYYGMLLGSAVAVSGGTYALSKKSKTLRDFQNNHPLLTFAAKVGAIAAAVTYIPRGASKLYNMIKPEVIAKAGNGVGEIAEHINKLKAPKFMQEWGKTISSYTPDIIKDLGKTAVAWAPDLTLATAALSALRMFVGNNTDMVNNYLGLKERQHQLAQARINELKNS